MQPELSNDVDSLLRRLAQTRPLFHSEADFQHALAWEIQRRLPEAQVRLEVPIDGLSGRGAVDVVVRHAGRTVAYELKYLKFHLVHEHDGEIFRLPTTSANDISRYDICKDVVRLEHMIGTGQIDFGFAVVLTNDPKLWGEGVRYGAIDDAFKLCEGRTLTGTLTWSGAAGPGTTKGREAPLCLTGTYPLRWQPYSLLDVRNGRFRALVVPVTCGSPLPAPAPDPVAAPLVRANRHRPQLREFLRTLPATEVTLTFDQIEALDGPLPPSAANHNAWWHHVASHPHAIWELEGYAASPHFATRQVTFRRRNSFPNGTTPRSISGGGSTSPAQEL